MLIYLDNAATSYPKPTIVTDAIKYSMLNYVSPNRGGYSLAITSTEALFETRETVAGFFNIDDSSRFIFTPGCTYSLNFALKGLEWEENDTVIISSLEHNSVYRPLLSLKKKYNLELITLPYLQHKGFDIDYLENILAQKKVKLIAITHASNVTGEILPIRKLIPLAKKFQVKLLVDGSQAVGNFPIDLSELDVDFYAFSGHKYLLGPPGVGILYVKDGLDLEPLIEGGTGSDSGLGAMPESLPDRLEPGTQNLPAIWTLNSAISFLKSEGIENIYKQKLKLITFTIEMLQQIDYLKCYSSIQNNIGIVSFNLNNLSPQKMATILDKKYKISVRAGLHCSPLAHKALQTYPDGCVRVSLSYFNTIDDINYLIKAVKEISDSSES